MQLNLSNNNLCVGKGIFGREVYTTKGIKAIAKALKVNASVTRVDVRANRIAGEGAKYIADMLLFNASLTSVR